MPIRSSTAAASAEAQLLARRCLRRACRGIVGALALGAGLDRSASRRPQIARVTISGFITDDRDQIDLLDKLAKSRRVKGVIVAIDFHRRRHRRRRGALRRPPQARRQEADGRRPSAPSAPPPPTWRRSPPTTSSPARTLDHRLDRRDLRVPRGQPAARQARRRRRGDQERAAQGRAVAVQAGLATEAKAVIQGCPGHLRLVRRHRRRAPRPGARRRADARRRTHLHRTPGACRQAHRRDRRRGGGARLARHEGRRHASCRSATGSRSGAAAASSRADAALLWSRVQLGFAPDLLRGSVSTAPAERLKLDGLLSVWQGSASGDDQIPLWGRRNDQIGTGPEDRRAEPASLSARRRAHRQRHPRRDHRGAGARRPRRAARLRRLLGQEPPGARRAAIRAPAPRSSVTREIRAVLQDRQGNARAPEPRDGATRPCMAAAAAAMAQLDTCVALLFLVVLVPLAIVIVVLSVANRGERDLLARPVRRQRALLR